MSQPKMCVLTSEMLTELFISSLDMRHDVNLSILPLVNTPDKTFSLGNVSVDDTISVWNSISSNDGGTDNIPSNFIKLFMPFIAP